MPLFLATSWLDPIVNAVAQIITWINIPVHNLGWSLVIFAFLFKLVFWQLNAKQFKAMIGMSAIAPKLKALQTKYGKSDPQRYQKESMELYKAHGVNPLAGCWPMLVQYPIIISVYWAVTAHKNLYENQHWLWIGSALSHHVPKIWGVGLLATNLGAPEVLLLVLYMISMYLYARYGTMSSTDPQQAQTQKLMAIMSPIMIGFLGFRGHWPSAMILYWFAYNAFSMGQQLYLLRRYHQPLSVLDSEHVVTDIPSATPAALPAKASTNGAVRSPNTSSRNRKKKKGAKR